MNKTIKHFVIPDTQCHPDYQLDYMRWVGCYLRDQVINCLGNIRVIHLGDHYDMPSLSSYDEGKKTMEGQTISADIAAGFDGLRLLMEPLHTYNASRIRQKKRQIWPLSMDITLGNHENRINHHLNANPKLFGTIGEHMFHFAEFGFTPHEFLKVIEYEGVLYSHFFPRGPRGHITQGRRGAPNARLQLTREHQSCTAGHQQGYDYSKLPTGNKILQGLIVGSCYPQDFDYLTPQGTVYWRGIIVKHDVHDGEYCLMEVDLKYLERRYG